MRSGHEKHGDTLNIRRIFRDRLVRFMTQPVERYARRSWIDVSALRRSIRKADVLLVEGDQRISVMIKYLTQSTWSHVALYIGDEILRRGGPQAEEARAVFGNDADSLLVEALPQGVVLSPLSKYYDFNMRLCRPHGLRAVHQRRILDDAIASVGRSYDLTNIRSLLFYFLPIEFFRRRFHGPTARSVSGALPTEVICTSLIGHLFQRVSFPVLPELTFIERQAVESSSVRRWFRKLSGREDPHYLALFQDISPTLLAPRDFDLSPYFEIVKFSVIERGSFDYTRIQWVDENDEVEASKENSDA